MESVQEETSAPGVKTQSASFDHRVGLPDWWLYRGEPHPKPGAPPVVACQSPFEPLVKNDSWAAPDVAQPGPELAANAGRTTAGAAGAGGGGAGGAAVGPEAAVVGGGGACSGAWAPPPPRPAGGCGSVAAGELEGAVMGEEDEPLPTRDELDRVQTALRELGRDPSTQADRERVAALDTVFELHRRVTEMVAAPEGGASV
jgi:hypothetical protein